MFTKAILLSMLLVSFQSYGYDIYAHMLMYGFSDSSGDFYYKLDNFNLYIPRYLFLSNIYSLAYSLELPMLLIPIFLLSIPYWEILKRNNDNSTSLIIFIILGYFFSGVSLVTIYIYAYFKSGKNYLLLGGFFHPIGFLLVPLILIKELNSKNVFFIFIFLALTIIFGSYSFNENIHEIKKINSENLYHYLGLVEGKLKSMPVLGALMFSIISYFVARKIKLLGKMINILPYGLIFLLFINSASRQNDSIIKDFLNLTVTEVFSVSVDFGYGERFGYQKYNSMRF